MWCDRMSDRYAFLWISGWAVPGDIWKPYWEQWPSVDHYALSFAACEQREQITERAVTTFQQIHVRPVTVVGWSLGAMVALQLALRFPKDVRHLFLISGVSQFVKRERREMGWDERVLRRMQTQLEVNPVEVLASFDRKMFSAAERQQGYLQQWRQQWRKELPPLPALQAGLDFLQHGTVVDSCQQIVCPVFLLSGAQDEICPTANTLAFAKQLPRATCTIWQESGHVCFWTQTERFQQWMREALQDVYR
jgi:pimeloyl-[acyl-carrier protein] methyl ester esterase